MHFAVDGCVLGRRYVEAHLVAFYGPHSDRYFVANLD